MYTYQVDENEIKEKLKQQEISSVEDLKNVYKEIDKENGFDFGEVGGYQKEEKNFDPKPIVDIDSSKIEEEAKDFFKDEMNKKKEDIESKYQNKEDKLENQKETLLEDQKKNEQKIENEFKDNSKKSLYNSIEQGIARSSIETNKQKELVNIKDYKLETLLESTNAKKSELEQSLNLLKEEKQKAMNDFDIAYALKINDKIAKLEEEYKKANEDAIKYNNSLEEEKRKFEEEQQRKSDEYDKEVLRKMQEHEKRVEELGVYNVYGEEVLKQKEDLALNFLNSISKSEAINICLTDIFVKNLGARRAYELYKKMKAREEK